MFSINYSYMALFIVLVLYPITLCADQKVVFSMNDSKVFDISDTKTYYVPTQFNELCKEKCKSISFNPQLITAAGYKITQIIPNQIIPVRLFDEEQYKLSNMFYECKCYGNQYLIEK